MCDTATLLNSVTPFTTCVMSAGLGPRFVYTCSRRLGPQFQVPLVALALEQNAMVEARVMARIVPMDRFILQI